MKKSTITIGIPTYNRPKYLYECLQSIKAQNIEKDRLNVFITDNASFVGTAREIIAKFPDLNIRYEKMDINTGLFVNFDRCFVNHETDYFLYTSDDDWLAPRFLERAMDYLDKEENQDVSMYASGAIYQDGMGAPIYTTHHPFIGKLRAPLSQTGMKFTKEEFLAMCAFQTPIFLCATVFRYTIMKNITVKSKLHCAEPEIYANMTKYGRTFYDFFIGGYARWHSGNISKVEYAEKDPEKTQNENSQSGLTIMSMAYSIGIDVQRFWYMELSKHIPEIKNMILNMLSTNYLPENLQALIEGNFRHFNKYNKERFLPKENVAFFVDELTSEKFEEIKNHIEALNDDCILFCQNAERDFSFSSLKFFTISYDKTGYEDIINKINDYNIHKVNLFFDNITQEIYDFYSFLASEHKLEVNLLINKLKKDNLFILDDLSELLNGSKIKIITNWNNIKNKLLETVNQNQIEVLPSLYQKKEIIVANSTNNSILSKISDIESFFELGTTLINLKKEYDSKIKMKVIGLDFDCLPSDIKTRIKDFIEKNKLENSITLYPNYCDEYQDVFSDITMYLNINDFEDTNIPQIFVDCIERNIPIVSKFEINNIDLKEYLFYSKEKSLLDTSIQVIKNRSSFSPSVTYDQQSREELLILYKDKLGIDKEKNYADDDLKAIEILYEICAKYNISDPDILELKSSLLRGLVTNKSMFEKSILPELADSFFENDIHFLARKVYQVINTPESNYRIGLSFFKEEDYASAVDYFVENFEAGLNNKDIFNMIATSLEKLGVYFDR